MVITLIKTRINHSLVFFSALSFLFICGGSDIEGMLTSFVNPSLITLILLIAYISNIRHEEIITYLIRFFFRSGSLRSSLMKITLISSLMSAFLNNTAVVTSLMGPVKNNRFFSPSKILIPLSYAAVLGGTLTLIGTSTNLVVNGFLEEFNLPPFLMFDFFYAAFPAVILSLIYIICAADKFLPERDTNDSVSNDKINYFLEAEVERGSNLINKSIKDNKLRNLKSLFLVEILRNDTMLTPVRPDEILYEGDVLVFSGDVKDIDCLNEFSGLNIFGEPKDNLDKNLVEAVVSHESDLIGTKIKDADFRKRFNAGIIAVRRGEKLLSGKIGLIELLPGDFLVLAVNSDFFSQYSEDKNFYYINSIKNEKEKLKKISNFLPFILFICSVVISASGFISLLKALVLSTLISLAAGEFKFSKLRESVNLDLLILIGSAIGISKVLISSGTADMLGKTIAGAGSYFGVYGAFAGIYILTLVLTELITNNAAAAIAFPLGVSAALSLNADPSPFIMAVALGASCSFLTPYGYQTNTLIYSAGNYRFTDYIRFGLPVTIIYSLSVCVSIPVFFPFN